MGVFLTILYISTTISAVHAVDKTREPMSVGPDVVKASIKMIQDARIFDDDKNLLRRTAYVESLDGLHKDTFVNKNGKPYHGGIGQIDEIGFKDTQDIASHSKLVEKFRLIKIHFGIDWPKVTWVDLRKPLHAMIAMRLYYSNIKEAIPRSVADQAAYWKLHYNKNGSGTVEHFIELISKLENQTCSSAKADIIFVLDSSGSIGRSNFLEMLNFTENIVKRLPLARDKVNVGILQYSSNVREELSLNTSNTDVDYVTDIIRNIIYMSGGTSTHLALLDLLQMSLAYGRRASGAAQLGYVITDGRSSSRYATEAAATQAKNNHIHLCAIGVGSGYDLDELRAIASGGSCVSQLTDFEEFDSFAFTVQQSSCRAVARLPSMPAVDGKERRFRGVTSAKTPLYYSTDVPAIGLTVRIGTAEKNDHVDLYVSYTETNPSSAVYDLKGSSTEMSTLFIPPRRREGRARRAVEPDTSNTTTDSSTVYIGIYGTKPASSAIDFFLQFGYWLQDKFDNGGDLVRSGTGSGVLVATLITHWLLHTAVY